MKSNKEIIERLQELTSILSGMAVDWALDHEFCPEDQIHTERINDYGEIVQNYLEILYNRID